MASEKLAENNQDARHKVQFVAASKLHSFFNSVGTPSTPTIVGTKKSRTILIATMEYGIEDWNIKINIGGLGAMAEY